MKGNQGFSLVELLIVVAIIAIIAAIAIPSLLTSRQAANEASAIQGCRTIGSAEIAFSATSNQQYTDLATLVAGNFLDSRYSAGSGINGYTYADGAVPNSPNSGAPPNSFQFLGTPLTNMGRFQFGVGPDQVVRYVSAQNGASLPTGVVAGDPIGKAAGGGS